MIANSLAAWAAARPRAVWWTAHVVGLEPQALAAATAAQVVLRSHDGRQFGRNHLDIKGGPTTVRSAFYPCSKDCVAQNEVRLTDASMEAPCIH
ncbi:hypothetical protein B0H10DRAFT_814071 [Mycena sp. CBHHK59/15]|nr:hypothetical protein B0H10DRAFT_814071 [Mycena sp. CBHHK59/15]